MRSRLIPMILAALLIPTWSEVSAVQQNTWGCPVWGNTQTYPAKHYLCLPESPVSGETLPPNGWKLAQGGLVVDSEWRPFTDTDDRLVRELVARGMIKGYGDGRFGPKDLITRAQMAALIARAMGWDQEAHGNPFSDEEGTDPDLWRNVGTLAHYGVVMGYGDGRFGPNDRVTQAQMFSFITRAMMVKEIWTAQPYISVPTIPEDHAQDINTYLYYTRPWTGGLTMHLQEPANRLLFVDRLYMAIEEQISPP